MAFTPSRDHERVQMYRYKAGSLVHYIYQMSFSQFTCCVSGNEGYALYHFLLWHFKGRAALATMAASNLKKFGSRPCDLLRVQLTCQPCTEILHTTRVGLSFFSWSNPTESMQASEQGWQTWVMSYQSRQAIKHVRLEPIRAAQCCNALTRRNPVARVMQVKRCGSMLAELSNSHSRSVSDSCR